MVQGVRYAALNVGQHHQGPGVCVAPLCGVAGSLEVGVEDVEVIQQAVCGADGAGVGPVVCDVL